MRRQPIFRTYCAAVILCTSWTAAAQAQDGQFCVATENAAQPARQVVECGNAVSIEREAGAELTIQERANNAAPRVIELKRGAILIDVTPGSATTLVRTPHALATVRGTTYIVDADQDTSAVFVIEGQVAVQRANDASTVTLSAGEGADVTLTAPMTVQTWSETRARALLARFGR